MAYQKIGFKNGNVLTAEQLIHMENGIIEAEKKAGAGTPGAGTPGAGTPGAGGTGLPSDAGAYKYMATAGDGQWQAVDRLAWKESKVESKTLYHFTKKANDFTFGILMTSDNLIPDCVVGNTYHVECPQLGVDDVVVCDSFELKSPRLLIEGKLSIYYDFMENATSFVNEAGNYEADKSYDFIISEQAEVETVHTIPAEYLPAGIGSFVVKVIENWDEGGEITCDKTYAEIKAAIESGVNVTCLYYPVEEGIHYFNGRYNQAWLGWDNSGNQCAVIYGFVGDMSNGSYYAGFKFTESGPSYISDKDLAFGRNRFYLKGDFFVGSSTPGSNKVFRIEVDDSGTITAQALSE